VTQAIAGFPALPAVADELCFVIDGPIQGLMSSDGACPSLTRGKGALAGEGFADATFTEVRLRDLLGTPGAFSVLHIGTHFRLRPGNALRSYLLLGATLWPVEDTSTAQLMRTLYDTFAVNHGDAALGLQHAQQALRLRKGPKGRANADPYYWAGFFVASSRP
jgi:CHAT domain-containing protein